VEQQTSNAEFTRDQYKVLVNQTEAETKKLDQSHDQTIKELREWYQRQLASLKAELERAHATAIAELEISHKGAVKSLQAEHNLEQDHLQRQIEEVKTQKSDSEEALQADVEKAAGTIADLRVDVQKISLERDELQERLEETTTQMRNTEKSMQADLDKATSKNNGLEDHVKKINQERDDLRNQLNDAITQKRNTEEALQADINKAESKSGELEADVQRIILERNGLQTQLENAATETRNTENKLQADLNKATSRNEDLESNMQKITQERNDTQKDLDDAIAQKRQIEEERDNLQTQLGNANTHMHRAIEAVHFQATSAHAAEMDLDLVEEIMDLVARTGQLTVRTTEATAPALTFASGHHRSTQYGFWLASRIGTAQQVIEEVEGVFNPRQITAEQANQALWIQNALEQLVNRFVIPVSQDQANVQVAMVVLQGVAYLRGLLPSYNADSVLTYLGQFIGQLNDGFIIASMRQTVTQFILSSQPIQSWIPSDGLANRMLDHTNSDSAEGVCLIADHSGMFMLASDKGSAFYIFAKDDVESLLIYTFDGGDVGRRILRMKPRRRLPYDLQSLTLATKVQAVQVQKWIQTFLGSLMKIC